MRTLCFILLILITVQVNAQDSTGTEPAWFLKFAVRNNLPNARVLMSEITDHLIESDEDSYSMETASVSYFFSDAWGLDFSYQMFITKDYYVKHDAFYDVLENRFGSDFFVSLTADSRRDIKTGTGRSGRVLAGLMYRKRFGNLLLLPRMLIGTTFFHTNTGSAFLKEKDANNLYAISYSADKTSQGFVTLAPTFTLGYQLFKRVVIGLDAQYSYCNINFGYEEELNTLSSSQTNVLRKIPYSQQLHTISLGAGVIFTFD